MQIPNWSKWLQMPELELWQAVALSLNVEPDILGSVCYEEEDGMWYSFHDVNTIERFPIGIFEPPAIRDEFIRRKAILEGHVNSGKHFTASVQTKGAHKYVAFNEFVVWSGDQGWTSPDELKPVESTRTEVAQAPEQASGNLVGSSPNALMCRNIVHKTNARVRELDSMIRQAMQQSKNPNDHLAVFHLLKEMALEEETPFTGVVDRAKGLEYTSATRNDLKYLSTRTVKSTIKRLTVNDN
ncbi:MAG: hypothetical protein WCG12_18950 [Alcaligenaceae bacterium]